MSPPGTRARLLVVPPVAAEDVRFRSLELARRLAGPYDVTLLWVEEASVAAHPRRLRRRARQVRRGLRALLRRSREEPRGGIAVARAPYLSPAVAAFLGPWGLHLARAFNRRVLEHLVRRGRFDMVLMGSRSFYLPRNAPSVFDFVDWLPEDDPAMRADIEVHIAHLRGRAAGFLAASESMAAMLRARFGLPVEPLPNGADLALARVPASRRAQVRARAGLDDRYVVGYVGLHGPWAGVDFVLEAVQALRRRVPEAHLLLVGPSEAWRPVLDRAPPGLVTATGRVPEEDLPGWLHAIDVGVIAKEPSPGTDYCHHLKLTEYTACRKFVVTTPSAQVAHLAWPHVLVAPRDPDAWAAALVRAKALRWDPSWDRLAEDYAWDALAARLAAYLGARLATPRDHAPSAAAARPSGAPLP